MLTTEVFVGREKIAAAAGDSCAVAVATEFGSVSLLVRKDGVVTVKAETGAGRVIDERTLTLSGLLAQVGIEIGADEDDEDDTPLVERLRELDDAKTLIREAGMGETPNPLYAYGQQEGQAPGGQEEGGEEGGEEGRRGPGPAGG